MRKPVVAAIVVVTTVCWGFGPLGSAAQVIRQAQPKAEKKIELPSVEDAAQQIAAAKSVAGADLPAGEILKKAAGTVDGETISFNELLDEVMVRYGSPYVQPLLNQAVMELVVMKRGAVVSDAELLEEVRYAIAQNKGKGTLKEQLERGRMGWSQFERGLRTKAAINKLVKADQNIKDAGPPNQFLMQVWFGGIRSQYQMEMAPEKLPKNCFGEVRTTWDAAGMLREIRAAAAAGHAYRTSNEPAGDGPGRMVFTPADGGWPRFYVPDVSVTVLHGSRTTQSPLTALLPAFTAGKATATKKILCMVEGSKTPIAMLPAVKVQKIEKDKPAEVSLTEALGKLTAGGYTVHVDTGEIRPTGEGAVYRLPQKMLETFEAPFRTSLTEFVAGLGKKIAGGQKLTATEAVVGTVDGDSGLILFPEAPIELKSQVDRARVLGFAFGSLKLAQFEEALTSLSKFRAVKRAFKGYMPGSAAGAEKAPWGVITVDEAAVAARIAAERKKYDGTIFPWHMICSILGKTVPEEMRRFWVGNGVDQVIGVEVTDEQLKKYFDDNIEHFGVATVEASHILVQMKDEKTGRIQWDKAKKRAEELLAMVKTGADFTMLAQVNSEDMQTKNNGGDLGLFTLVSRYNYDLCKAAFAMEPGQVSDPVKTKLGYHIIRLRKKSPPNLEKYGWESKDMTERVREYRQDEREAKWLDDNVYSKFKSQSMLEDIVK